MTARPRILLVGPRPIAGDVIGGTKVAFAGLVEEVEAAGVFDVEVHDTSRARTGRGPLRRAFDELAQFTRLVARLLLGPAAPVVFNVSAGGLLKSGPFVWACCRLRRRRLAVRVFGGDLDLFYEGAARPVRALARRTFLRAEQVWVERQALVRQFDDGDGRLRWWPNTRDLAPRPPRPRACRFLFLGQLRREKGVAEAIEAAAALPPGVTLTVQGPPMPGYSIDAAAVGDHVELRPAAPSAEVPSILAEHDVLVFASYHAGEGIPGIVVEALQVGLPVIASRWRSVPELIVEEESGLLVEPRDVAGLAEAMRWIAEDTELFARLQAGTRAAGDRLRTDRWRPVLHAWLDELAQRTSADHDATAGPRSDGSTDPEGGPGPLPVEDAGPRQAAASTNTRSATPAGR